MTKKTPEIVINSKEHDGDAPLSKKIEKSRTSQKNKSYVLDLKIHSPRSLLGSTPLSGIDAAPALVRLAVVKGIDIIAVTDRHTAGAIDAISSAARGSQLTVIPGVELRTVVDKCDDVVLTCLFPEHCTGGEIAEFLREIDVPPTAANEPEFIVTKPFAEILKFVEMRSGVAFPSRIDKTPNRLNILPKLVEEFGFRAFDLAYSDSARIFARHWPKVAFSFFSFSNANALAQVGSRSSKVKMTAPGYEGVRELVRRSIAF